MCRSALTSKKHPHRNHQLLETYPEDVMSPRSVHSQLSKKESQSGERRDETEDKRYFALETASWDDN